MKNYYLLELVFFSFLFLLATKHVHCTPIVNADLQGITHNLVQVNGIDMHVADKGEGPVILFIHGYPQLWYSWRHQIQSLSLRGYRTVAPDLRGYGDSDAPPSVNNYTSLHIVGDLIGLLDMLGIDQVLLVAHDWGAMIAWYMSMFRPDRIKAMVILSVAFNARNPHQKPTERMRSIFGDDFYVCRFQEPGVAEAEYARADLHTLFKKILTNREPGPHRVPKSIGFGAVPKTPIILPSWLTEEDINYYATKYNKSGFTGPLNYYRNLDLDWELTAPWTREFKVKVPVKFIVGDLDMTYTIPGMKQYVNNDMKTNVPNLQEIVEMKGVGHFIQEEKPKEISDHIFNFFQKF